MLEGGTDVLFFNKIIKPKLLAKYTTVQLLENYVKLSKHIMNKFVSYLDNNRIDYILFADFDDADFCKTKKEAIKKHKVPNIDLTKIAIVKTEIESWYLAGLTDMVAHSLGIVSIPASTDSVTKEQFCALIPNPAHSISYMQRIIQNYSLETAKRRNQSFSHFCDQFLD